jgi:hypothetical protein
MEIWSQKSSTNNTTITHGKRKLADEIENENYEIEIDDSIKKLKLCCSPGELRLNNDLKLIDSKDGIGLLYDIVKIDTLKIGIRFTDNHIPNQFIVEATERYPYVVPIVYYAISRQNFELDQSGVRVLHEYEFEENISYCDNILPHWTPILGLLDIIKSIYLFRENGCIRTCDEMTMVVEHECDCIADIHSA